MKKNKLIYLGMSLVLAITTLVGCGTKTTEGSTNNEVTTSKKELTVEFWTAPEQYNYDFWSTYAEKFNATKTEVNGQIVKVNVQQMPAQPSSEAGIQNAIATGSTPAASENINRSFGSTLAESQAIYDLSSEDWFNAIIEERKISDTMKGWQIDGAQYVLPLYVNPFEYIWNSKALRELGIEEVPTTLAEFNDILDKYNQKTSELNEQGITHFMYRYELSRPDSWWERWFDFEAQYNAFAQKGTSFVEGNTLQFDTLAAEKVFELYGSMEESLLLGEIPGIWQEETVPVVVGIGLPWEIAANKAAGKVYGMDGDYVYSPMLVENEGDTPYNYADSKGIVLYKGDNISEDEHNGIIEFLKYTFTGEGKDTFDIDWLEATSMLPVRGDLGTKEELTEYFNNNPELKATSEFVPYAVPGMAHGKMAEILTALAEGGLTPYVTETSTGGSAEASTYVEKALEAMKTAGGLK